MNELVGLILAAGKGTRMKSKLPKVLHKVAGKAMVERVLEAAQSVGAKRNVVIIGFGGDDVKAYLGDRVEYVTQLEQKGTGHAVQQAESVLGKHEGLILLLCGDTPLVTQQTLEQLLAHHKETGAAATVLTAYMDNPYGYGRIIRNETKSVERIVEEKDGTLDELKVHEVNTGMYIFDSKELWPCLEQLSDANAQGELYITDVVSILVKAGKTVSAYMTMDSDESLGVNSRLQLAQAELILRNRTNLALMEAGITLVDPHSTYIAPEVVVGPDTIIYPNTTLEGNTVVGTNNVLGPNTRLSNVTVGDNNHIHDSYAHDCEIKNDTVIGPFVHLRPDTVLSDKVKIGNFVEVKNSVVGTGTKLPHLSYIGDSDVGSKVNIGCGTITVNYDGKKKHRTIIENGVFVGCNSNLVAPVTIGSESYVAAGSTITKDVPSRALAFGRARQVVKENWVTEDTFKK